MHVPRVFSIANEGGEGGSENQKVIVINSNSCHVKLRLLSYLHIKIQSDLSRRSFWIWYATKKGLQTATVGRKEFYCICHRGIAAIAKQYTILCRNFTITFHYACVCVCVCALKDADWRQLANKRCKLIKLKHRTDETFSRQLFREFIKHFFFVTLAINLFMKTTDKAWTQTDRHCKQFLLSIKEKEELSGEELLNWNGLLSSLNWKKWNWEF